MGVKTHTWSERLFHSIWSWTPSEKTIQILLLFAKSSQFFSFEFRRLSLFVCIYFLSVVESSTHTRYWDHFAVWHFFIFFYVIFGTTAIISFFHFDWILLSPVFPRFSLFEKILHFLHYFFNWFGYLDGFILNTVSKSSFRASCGFCISFLCFDLKFTSDI